MFNIVRKKFFIVVGLFVLLFCTTLLSSCFSTNNPNVKVNTTYSKDELELCVADTLHVTTAPGFPPFEYIEDGSLVGFDIDLAHLIADSLGLKLNITPYSYDQIFNVLRSDYDYDLIISGVVKEKISKENIDCTEPYYIWPEKMLLVSKNESSINEYNIDSLLNSSQIKVGIIRTSSFMDDFKHLYPNTNIVQVEGYGSLVNLLDTTQADVVILDEEFLETFENKNSYKVIKSIDVNEEIVIALNKGCPKLLQTINEVLNVKKEDSSIDKLIKKYEDQYQKSKNK